MRIAMAQLNPTVGDIAGNTRAILAAAETARAGGADLLVTPELSLIGYPPRDLLLKPAVLGQMRDALAHIAGVTKGIGVLVGYAEENRATVGRRLFNTAALLVDGQIAAQARKSLLPTYDVFDESRYFEPGPNVEVVNYRGKKLGLSICEDLWNDEELVGRRLYPFNPVEALARGGADLLINMSASPFVLGKNDYRRRLVSHQARRWKMPVVYVNQVGANDELIFDGNSLAVAADGQPLAQAADFAADLVLVDIPPAGQTAPLSGRPPASGITALYAALVMGLNDYARKCGFKTAVLGISGGIDSAVVAALAAAALGANNVTGIALPSRYSSDHSLSDAAQLALALKIQYRVIPIEPVHAAMETALADEFHGLSPGIAEENIQARIRGNILMSLSNKFGHLLLTTGNKSEIATGYCTLYGDMCGGLAVISDVPKTMVYPLAEYINTRATGENKAPPIPQSTLTKPPSAELRPNQKDQDSLPPYDVLDGILQMYVEEEKSVPEIVAAGWDEALVMRVARLVDTNEYKRKQMPPGLKVTSRAFGYGRRMPIAQRYNPGPICFDG